MWLDEHDSKELLREVGILSPAGDTVHSPGGAARVARAVGVPAYVKALAPAADRAAKGGVVRVESVDDSQAAFDMVTTRLGVERARIEKEVADGRHWYLSVGLLDGRRDRVTALFSSSGGSGIEQRGPNVAGVAIDPLVGARPFHARRLGELAKVAAEDVPLLESLLNACYSALNRFDAELVELNPVSVTGNSAVALDARVIVDDYALFRQPRVTRTESARRDAGSMRRALAELGIEYVPLAGRIGIIGLGAGLTMHIADWIDELGGSPAFFFDATVAAVRDWAAMFRGDVPDQFAASLSRGIRLVGDSAAVLLVNFTSGGTPVDALCKGLAVALRDAGWNKDTIVHVGGNRNEFAAAVLAQAGLRLAPTLGDAIAHAVEVESSVRRA